MESTHHLTELLQEDPRLSYMISNYILSFLPPSNFLAWNTQLAIEHEKNTMFAKAMLVLFPMDLVVLCKGYMSQHDILFWDIRCAYNELEKRLAETSRVLVILDLYDQFTRHLRRTEVQIVKAEAEWIQRDVRDLGLHVTATPTRISSVKVDLHFLDARPTPPRPHTSSDSDSSWGSSRRVRRPMSITFDFHRGLTDECFRTPARKYNMTKHEERILQQAWGNSVIRTWPFRFLQTLKFGEAARDRIGMNNV